jgi:NAD(P)-dependent dehydrogenase (short-subunit alcohol dehydrogenase family)
MGWLNDRVAIVTEGGAGIGEAVVLQPSSEGATVVVSGLEYDPIDDVVRTASGVGPGAVACAAALEEYRRLDILVNNAATEADRMCRADAWSLVLMARSALQSLRRSRGVLLSAGGTADVPGIPNTAIYGATEGFATSFTLGVAAELAADGVRAVAVVPGPTETGQTRPEVGPHTPEAAETIVESTIVGRRATVEEIANVCAFLASDEARFVTGVVWVVDGGTGISRGLPGRLGDIPSPPLTLPVRHSLGGFEHSIGEKPGEAG